LYPVICVKLTPQDRYGYIRLKQGVGSKRSQGTDYPRVDRLKLLDKKGLAGSYFLWLGIPVTGRTALEDIAYIDITPLQSHGRDNPGQKLPGAADKGSPLDVFISSRRLADEYDLGLRVPLTEDDVGSHPSEGTPLTITEFIFDFSESQCLPG